MSKSVISDISKRDVRFDVVLTPHDFLVNLNMVYEEGHLIQLRMSMEQQQTLVAALLGIPEAKVQAVRNLVKTNEQLVSDELFGMRMKKMQERCQRAGRKD